MAQDPLEIIEVKNRRDRNAFIELPWKIYRDDPYWVPPLLMERKAFINPKKNPFFQHADVAFFLAKMNGQRVGRIAAIVNHNHNEFHGERVGFFGLFECQDRYEIAEALFLRAGAWLKERGMEVMRGPASYSTNEEVGLLVEGFNESPMILMPYNPPYYVDFIEKFGFQKAKDLFAYIRTAEDLPERVYRIVEKVKQKGKFHIRKVNIKDLPAEMDRFKQVYNEAWEKNWGFVPMTEAEIDHMAKELKQILDPDLIFFVETDEQIVGFSLTLPDINQALKKVNGRLFPFGLFKLLYYSRKIDQLRVLVLGVNEKFRKKGVDVLLYTETFKEGIKKGYKRGEFSWILEDNAAMVKPLEAIGARKYKTYRIYDKAL